VACSPAPANWYCHVPDARVARVVEVSSTSTGSEAVPLPGPVRSRSGLATASPEVSDGGGLSAPQADGSGPMSKSRTAPSASSECGNDVESYAFPSTFSDCT
jgi:hypothetical protein